MTDLRKIMGLVSVLVWIVSIAHAQNSQTYRIDVPKALKMPGNKNLSSIASEVRYIPLEAKPGSFVKRADLLQVCKNLFSFTMNRPVP